MFLTGRVHHRIIARQDLLPVKLETTAATNTVAATYTSDIEFWLRLNGALIARKMNLAGNGQLTLDGYGSATFNGTVRYLLAVDTSGNVQEVTTAGLTNAANDAGAAAAGVPVNGIYRNGSVLQIRTV
ncbi:hypothetical protein EBR96_07465 [bacterium]|nr:hypothetical protein [bacterium]